LKSQSKTLKAPLIGAYVDKTQVTPEASIARRSEVKQPIWYLHTLGTKAVRLSLRTSDKQEAITRTIGIYQAWKVDPTVDLAKLVAGPEAHLVGFKQCAEEWLVTVNKDRINKESALRKFLLPFFHEQKQIADIRKVDDDLVEQYKLWRKGQGAGGKSEPSPNTLNREYPTLRQILNFAERKKYLPKGSAPQVEAEDASPNQRPAFLGDDYDKLMAEAVKWAAEEAPERHCLSRELLVDWIFVGRHTGLRLPHEANKLTWKHIRLDTNGLSVPPDTKTGARTVTLTEECVERLQAMRERREAFCRNQGQTWDAGEKVFVQKDGSSPLDLAGLFRDLVERCKFPQPAGAKPLTTYGLRHTYAIFSLAEGIPEAAVAELMGTSSKMLKQHYTHGMIEQTRQYLKKRQAKSVAVKETVKKNLYIREDADRKTVPLVLTPSAPISLNLISTDELPEGHPGRIRIGIIKD
jgi:integrase